MKHVVFALFGDKDAAEKAIQLLVQEHEAHKENISLIVHRDAANPAAVDKAVQHTDVAESDAKHGLALGAWLGAATGAAVGALLAGPFGLFGAGPLIGSLFGAGAGTAYGMLGAGLVGAGLTDQSLKELSERVEKGDVLITVQTEDGDSEKRVEEILRSNGAEVSVKDAV